MAQPIKPTPIPPLPLDRVPQLGTDTFDEDALIFTDWEATKLAPGINAAATNVYDNAKTVFEQSTAAMAATGTAQQRAEAAAAQAAQYAASAGAASNARSWQSGHAYNVNDMAWGVSTPGVLYRCIAAHSGSSTAPEADATHWVSVGARLSMDPLSGSLGVSIEYDAHGQMTKVTEQYSGKPAVTTLTWSAAGQLQNTKTVYDGKTRIDTLSYSADGAVAGITTRVE